jgi:hypothetical protein
MRERTNVLTFIPLVLSKFLRAAFSSLAKVTETIFLLGKMSARPMPYLAKIYFYQDYNMFFQEIGILGKFL